MLECGIFKEAYKDSQTNRNRKERINSSKVNSRSWK